MDWENVIDWDAVDALSPEQVNHILAMFEGYK